MLRIHPAVTMCVVSVMPFFWFNVHAAGVESHVISKDHVNLVRVPGEKITDVVFDGEALEIQTDKTRGVIFVRVKPMWTAQGNTQTAAFVNTAAGSSGVTFKIETIPSQIVELAPVKAPQETLRMEDAAAVPLARFADSDYVTELKTLVRDAQRGSFDESREAGAVWREGGGQRAAPLTFSPRKSGCGALTVRETKAWSTADKVVERLVVTNFSAKPLSISPALFAKAAPGTLAVALEKAELMTGEAADVVVIRSRAAAQAAGRAAGRPGLVLAADALSEFEKTRIK